MARRRNSERTKVVMVTILRRNCVAKCMIITLCHRPVQLIDYNDLLILTKAIKLINCNEAIRKEMLCNVGVWLICMCVRYQLDRICFGDVVNSVVR